MLTIKNLIFLGEAIVIAIAFLAVASCHKGEGDQERIVHQDMTVKTISDTLQLTKDSSDDTANFLYVFKAELDIPTDGPKPLVDSVKLVIAKELYDMFDGGDAEEKTHIPLEKVLEWNDGNIITSFINHYGPLYEKYAMGVGEVCLVMKLVAQSKTYVTYYVEQTDCGASCNHDYKCYTLRKSDGHLLENVITDKELRKFVKKHPQYEVDDDAVIRFIGLSDEGLLYGIHILFGDQGSEGGTEIDTIPYTLVKSYLDKEARELIQN